MKAKYFTMVVAAAVMATSAMATDTLDKIAKTGVMTLGYRETSVPFSYLLDDGKPTGYGYEVCNAIADAVKKDLNMPNLKIQYQAVTSANRIPLIQNGTVDIECGSTTNSKVRQEQAAFGINYFGIQVTAAVAKKSGIKSLMDLNGKNVSVTNGTTAVALIQKYAKDHNLKIRLLPTKNFAEGMQLVDKGRADAFILDDVLLAGQIANLAKPGDYTILDDSLSTEPYAPMFAKDDPKFKALVDKTMLGMIKSGEMDKLYKKWFVSPIPPKGINLNFPKNKVTTELFAHPNSDGI